MKHVLWVVGLAAALLAAAGCSDDEDPAYAGVVEWKCYQFGEESCGCDGLKPGEDSGVAGSDVTEVDVCPAAFSVCRSFRDDGDWECECREAEWEPDEGVTDVREVSACPP